MERSVGELDAGVRESYADVRELLLHFHTRHDSGAAAGRSARERVRIESRFKSARAAATKRRAS